MPWTFGTTSTFDRQAHKFLKKHPEMRQRLKEVLKRLAVDPFDPALRLHALTGKLNGLQAIRIDYRYRIVLTLQVHAEEILLLDIGSHDVVYK